MSFGFKGLTSETLVSNARSVCFFRLHVVLPLNVEFRIRESARRVTGESDHYRYVLTACTQNSVTGLDPSKYVH
jgi:hypothetical protein